MVARAQLRMIDKEGQPGRESTDMALFQVRTSQEDISGWDRRRGATTTGRRRFRGEVFP